MHTYSVLRIGITDKTGL